MQTLNKKKITGFTSLVALSLMFLSFSSRPGGDSYEIYLNKKLVMQQYVAALKGSKQIALNEGNYNDDIDVYYSHCGVLGKERSIMIKDAGNKVIKTWQFANASGNNKGMNIKAKDILALQKTNGGNLQLYYASQELPGGRLLASIVKENPVRKI